MLNRTRQEGVTAPACSHELRFASYHHPGRGVAVPCDASGQVDLDLLSESLRNAYFAARALVGGEYLYPTVRPAHWVAASAVGSTRT